MKAVASMGGMVDYRLSEIVANAWVRASIDVDEYFMVWNRLDVRTQVLPSRKIEPVVLEPSPLPT